MVLAAALFAGGCRQQAGGIFYRPQASPDERLPSEERVELAADSGGTQRLNPMSAASNPTSQPSTGPAKAARYTAPGPRIRQLSLLPVLSAAAAGPGLAGAGREAAEASLSVSPSASVLNGGIPGLGAPQPAAINVVAGQPGLHRGYTAALGFAAPANILRAGPNPLSGPNGGKCGELVGAGLFPNQAACQRYFQKK
jgi:hypothetical protein